MNRSILNPFPPSVRRIGIPAPAGRPDRASLEQACAFLKRCGIDPVPGRHLFADSEEPYFASSRENRAEDFNSFLRDESIDLILCARGGYGSMQILPMIDWETLAKRNLPVAGYSDITAIHLAMLAKKAGVPVTAKMASHLHFSLEEPLTSASTRRVMHLAFARRKPPFTEIATLTALRGAEETRGKIICANLTLLVSLLGTGYLPSFRNKIVILEEIGEPPRKLDRSLVQLQLSGVLDHAAAVIFGNCRQCGTKAELRRVASRFMEQCRLPVYTGLCFGHCDPSLAFLCGEDGILRGRKLFVRGIVS